MKQWTKNNMKLFSKWRASKRTATEAAAACLSAPNQTTSPRGVSAAQEQEAGAEADEPMGPLTCFGDKAGEAEPAGDYKPFNSDETGKGDAGDGGAPQTMATNDGKDNNETKQSIFVELFAHFRRRSLKKKLFTFLVVLTIVPVFLDLFVLRTGHVAAFIDDFLDWMAENPLLGVWAYVSMIALTSLVFVPPSVLVFAAGFTFQSIWGAQGGLLIALVASFLGSMIGGLIGFWRAKYMTRDLVEVLMRRYPLIKAVDAAIVRNSLRVMVLMRLNCLIPFGVLNYVFGITGVDWVAFLLAMVGILPWLFLLVFLGASAEHVYDEYEGETTVMEVVLIATGIAFCVIGMAITWRFAKKELQKEVEAAPPSTAADYHLRDPALRPWRSNVRRQPVPSVEDADLRPPSCFRIQFLGEGDASAGGEDGTEADEYYQTRMNWNEIILDDFS